MSRKLALAALLALVACSDTQSGNLVDDAGVVCNMLNLKPTPTVAVQSVAGAAPASTGGTIADGTYYVTASTIYSGTTTPVNTMSVALQEIFVIENGTFEASVLEAGVATTVSGTFAYSGTTATIASSCPVGSTANDAYSASGNTFTLYTVGTGFTVATEFTKQ